MKAAHAASVAGPAQGPPARPERINRTARSNARPLRAQGPLRALWANTRWAKSAAACAFAVSLALRQVRVRATSLRGQALGMHRHGADPGPAHEACAGHGRGTVAGRAVMRCITDRARWCRARRAGHAGCVRTDGGRVCHRAVRTRAVHAVCARGEGLACRACRMRACRVRPRGRGPPTARAAARPPLRPPSTRPARRPPPRPCRARDSDE
jgi:hypothetical protein